jgi:4-hydroxy-tetrahydrodipicolinate reductase
VLRKLVEDASRLLGADFDVEVIESHHNRKADSPSGTASLIVDSVKSGAAKNYDVLYGREKNTDKPRQKGELAVHSVRGGSIVGTHEVIYAGEGEVIRVSHEALSKQVFATGAIKAAFYVNTKRNGYFTMDDMIRETLK